MRQAQRWSWVTPAYGLVAVLAGCGTPGAPLPPSLNLPQRVTDLSAIRAGNRVTLTWTMPQKSTDKLILKDKIPVRICRREGSEGCTTAATLRDQLAAGKAGTYTDTLPADLAGGAPRMFSYFVELDNLHGRSAGLSNAAVVLAGEAPKPVDGLKAEVRKAGVVLHWTPDGEGFAVRLQRKLLSAAQAEEKQGALGPEREPEEQDFLIEDVQQGRALDKSIHFGEAYAYRAQRVARVTTEGRTLELAGELSEPVKVEAKDVFPPAVPTGLVAVASVSESGGATAIDLSWQPDAEPDTAGYVVYRREGDAEWTRISPAQPVVGPAFHDAHVVGGHTYIYVVSAVDEGGHESARSAEARETVPQN